MTDTVTGPWDVEHNELLGFARILTAADVLVTTADAIDYLAEPHGTAGCLPAVYVAGVTSPPEPLTEALARFSARTALLPRTNPVAETVADSRATSPVTNG